jgi:hypothetical protein
MKFVPHRKHIHVSLSPVTGIVLLFLTYEFKKMCNIFRANEPFQFDLRTDSTTTTDGKSLPPYKLYLTLCLITCLPTTSCHCLHTVQTDNLARPMAGTYPVSRVTTCYAYYEDDVRKQLALQFSNRSLTDISVQYFISQNVTSCFLCSIGYDHFNVC